MSGFTLKPYQKKGAAALYRSYVREEPCFILGDAPRLGKSVQSMAALRALANKGLADFDAFPILIVCPATVRQVWADAAVRFGGFRPHEVGLLVHSDGSKRLVGALRGTWNQKVLVCSYETAVAGWKRAEGDETRRFSVVIVDEAHYLKSPTAQRTQALYGRGLVQSYDLKGRVDQYGLTSLAFSTWILSGTLAPNDYSELWTHAARFLSERFPGVGLRGGADHDEWTRFFCDVEETVYGRKVTGHRNLDRMKKLLAPVSLARTRKDVRPDSPEPIIGRVPLDLTRQEVADLHAAYADAPDLADEIRARVEAALADGADAVQVLRQVAPNCSALRERVASAKVAPALRYLLELRDESVGKMVVFAHHKRALRRLSESFDPSMWAMVTGETPAAKRTEEVRRFQEDKGCTLFFGNITAAGTGISLAAASHVVFVEEDWVPANNWQAIMRAENSEKEEVITVDFLYVPKTLDDYVNRVVVQKTAELATTVLSTETPGQ